MKKRIRLLVVDGYEIARHGLRSMLESEDDMEIVGECGNAEEAFSQAVSLSPDIMLVDAHLPGMSGIEATRCFKQEGLGGDVDVIVLADCAEYLIEALKAGAAGYFIKENIKRAELAETIRQVYRNERLTFVEEAVELVIPPPADAAQRMRFISQVETRLDASILQTVGSLDGGTNITILLKPDQLSDLLDKLADMPDVEKAQEEPLTEDRSSKEFRTLPWSRASLRKKIRVTLRQGERQNGTVTKEREAKKQSRAGKSRGNN